MLKLTGKLADELQGTVQPWPLPGRFKSIRCEGNWQKWSIKETQERSEHHHVFVDVFSSSKPRFLLFLGNFLLSRSNPSRTG